MERAARGARAGTRLINFIVLMLVLAMLGYGGYCLWSTYRVEQTAFTPKELKQFKPEATEEDNASLEELTAINQDLRGWLTIDGTNIDYPVVQGRDDMEYVNRDIYGKFAMSGSIFLSCLNSPDFSDPYNLVYGHHMANGAMFGDVVSFTDGEYFSQHRTGTLYLPKHTYGIEIFACMEADAYDRVIYGIETADVETIVAYLKENAVQYAEIGVTGTDRLIALSTCAESETNGRVIVFGKMTQK